MDLKTKYTFVLPLTDCKCTTITSSLQQLKIMAGKIPKILCTDYDPKLLSNKVNTWYETDDDIILLVPPDQ